MNGVRNDHSPASLSGLVIMLYVRALRIIGLRRLGPGAASVFFIYLAAIPPCYLYKFILYIGDFTSFCSVQRRSAKCMTRQDNKSSDSYTFAPQDVDASVEGKAHPLANGAYSPAY